MAIKADLSASRVRKHEWLQMRRKVAKGYKLTELGLGYWLGLALGLEME